MRGGSSEALASRKVVYREVCTEGSETAKSGTDEQKRYTRQIYSGKQPRSCNAQKEKRIDMYIPQRLDEGKSSYRGRSPLSRVDRGEVSRGHNSWSNEPTGRKKILRKEVSHPNEGLNVRKFQMWHGIIRSGMIACNKRDREKREN
jgi:hypothetical protein